MNPVGTPPHLSIVLPAYNEAVRIEQSIETIAAYVRDAGLAAEILVVDDGSRDATAQVATKALGHDRGRVISYSANRGKGHAFRRGVLEARGRWVLMTDVDLASPIEEYRKLAETLRDRDVDVVVGSRRVPGSGVEFDQTRLRRFASAVFNGLVRASTGLPLHDTQCGFKLLDRARVKTVVERMRVDGFAFDVELLFLCQRLGLQIAEIPVVWRGSDHSHVRLLKDPARMLADIARMRWNFRRGAYNEAQPAPSVSSKGA